MAPQTISFLFISYNLHSILVLKFQHHFKLTIVPENPPALLLNPALKVLWHHHFQDLEVAFDPF